MALLSFASLFLLFSVALARPPSQADFPSFSRKSVPDLRAPYAERTFHITSALSQTAAHALSVASLPALLRQTTEERREQIRNLRRRLSNLAAQLPGLRQLARDAQAALWAAQDKLTLAQRLLRINLLCAGELERFRRKCPIPEFAERNPEVCAFVTQDLELAQEVCLVGFDASGRVVQAENQRREAKGLLEKRTQELANLNTQVQEVTERFERALARVKPKPSNDPPLTVP